MKSALRLAAGAALIAAGGCQTLDLGLGGPKMTEVVTDPPGATMQVLGFGECETPCTVELDKPRTVTIAKAGFKALRFDLDPGKSRLNIKLELVAATEGVDETALPEID